MAVREVLWKYKQPRQGDVKIKEKNIYLIGNSISDANLLWAQSVIEGRDDYGFMSVEINDENLKGWITMIKPGDIVLWIKDMEIMGLSMTNKKPKGFDDHLEDEFIKSCHEKDIRVMEVTSITEKEDIVKFVDQKK